MNSTARRLLILLFGAGLAVMLSVTVYTRLSEPSLVTQARPVQAQRPVTAPPPDMGADSEMGRLMRMAGEQPDNPDTLFEIGTALVAQGKFREAAVFLERARAMDAGNADIAYYLGYIAHQEDRYEDAVAFMEESLALRDRADVHFSAATILRYFLKDTERAKDHLEKGLAAADCTPEQKASYSRELERLKAGE